MATGGAATISPTAQAVKPRRGPEPNRQTAAQPDARQAATQPPAPAGGQSNQQEPHASPEGVAQRQIVKGRAFAEPDDDKVILRYTAVALMGLGFVAAVVGQIFATHATLGMLLYGGLVFVGAASVLGSLTVPKSRRVWAVPLAVLVLAGTIGYAAFAGL